MRGKKSEIHENMVKIKAGREMVPIIHKKVAPIDREVHLSFLGKVNQ